MRSILKVFFLLILASFVSSPLEANRKDRWAYLQQKKMREQQEALQKAKQKEDALKAELKKAQKREENLKDELERMQSKRQPAQVPPGTD
jgi:septal ring factor EnvC (AmiA/AmiB activator)